MAMPVVALNDVLKVRFFCTLFNQIGINVGHYQCSAAGGALLFDEAVELISDNVADRYKDLLCSQATYNGAGISRRSPGTPTIEIFSTVGAGNGVVTGNPMPSQATGMISYKNFSAGPRNRGRQYIPFPSTGSSTTIESPSTTYVSALNALCADLLTFTLASGTGTATLKRIVYPGPGNPDWFVDQMKGQTKWATQKRRGDYGQPNAVMP